MSKITKKLVAVAGTSAMAGVMLLAAAPAASANTVLRICPNGYYGVEVYDPNGNVILWACVYDPL